MSANKIMVIRHAEKPSDDNTVKGVSVDGAPDPEQLAVRGWQRSGALVRFFAPLKGTLVDQRLATPHVIFASSVGKHSKSLRPQHTVLELATVLNLALVLRYPKGDEAALVADAVAANGPVLIAWEHEAIPDIANRILGNSTTCPQKLARLAIRPRMGLLIGRSSLGGASLRSRKCCSRATARSQSCRVRNARC